LRAAFDAEIMLVVELCREGSSMAKRKFTVLIEQDEEGYLVATVPALRGCHTQAKSLDGLMKRIREAIALCLEDEDDKAGSLELVGIQQVSI
jgi:predicted RNase H-like HicB family nuclease